MRRVYNEPATRLTVGVVRTTLPTLVYTILWEPGMVAGHRKDGTSEALAQDGCGRRRHHPRDGGLRRFR
ncbi:hypothetical protein GCM10027598_65460 [Amycolatopsis oliviviridis]